ncbi:hypothetical protein AABB24_020283, partial [Solanum stoloniferum]
RTFLLPSHNLSFNFSLKVSSTFLFASDALRSYTKDIHHNFHFSTIISLHYCKTWKLINRLFQIPLICHKQRKSKCSSGMEENRDNVSGQQTTSDRNLRRRTRYAEMSPERKKLFLSQLRQKRAESKREKLLHQSNSTGALTISTSSVSPQQACKPTTLPVTSTRGERIVNCLSTFEVGSTSITSHVATKLTSTCTANKGTSYSIKGNCLYSST